jgi:uracil-DNA glycosylase
MTKPKARLPEEWQEFLSPYFDLPEFYEKLDTFIENHEIIIPEPQKIFNVFSYMPPSVVRCVLYGEDPYPRLSSACGIAFWDKEIVSWDDKTNGNSLKNILKALLIAKGFASYSTGIDLCRKIAEQHKIKSPAELFEHWLKQGVLLINTSMTFSNPLLKKEHFKFWKPFHIALIEALNDRNKPYYILWGRKAQKWEKEILKSADDAQIIKQGHPTFIHQFLQSDSPSYSPFTELSKTCGIEWS